MREHGPVFKYISPLTVVCTVEKLGRMLVVGVSS